MDEGEDKRITESEEGLRKEVDEFVQHDKTQHENIKVYKDEEAEFESQKNFMLKTKLDELTIPKEHPLIEEAKKSVEQC